MDIEIKGTGLLTPRNVRPFLIGAIIASGTIFIASYLAASESFLKCAEFIVTSKDAPAVEVQPVKSVSTTEIVKPN